MVIGIFGIGNKCRMMQRFLLCGELLVSGLAAFGERRLECSRFAFAYLQALRGASPLSPRSFCAEISVSSFAAWAESSAMSAAAAQSISRICFDVIGGEEFEHVVSRNSQAMHLVHRKARSESAHSGNTSS